MPKRDCQNVERPFLDNFIILDEKLFGWDFEFLYLELIFILILVCLRWHLVALRCTSLHIVVLYLRMAVLALILDLDSLILIPCVE